MTLNQSDSSVSLCVSCVIEWNVDEMTYSTRALLACRHSGRMFAPVKNLFQEIENKTGADKSRGYCDVLCQWKRTNVFLCIWLNRAMSTRHNILSTTLCDLPKQERKRNEWFFFFIFCNVIFACISHPNYFNTHTPPYKNGIGELGTTPIFNLNRYVVLPNRLHQINMTLSFCSETAVWKVEEVVPVITQHESG